MLDADISGEAIKNTVSLEFVRGFIFFNFKGIVIDLLSPIENS